MNFRSLLRIVRIATICTASIISSDVPAQITSSPIMNITNSETSSSTTTFCAGRYALDVPVGSRLSGGNYIYKFTRLEKPEQVSLQSFEAVIAEKEKALKAMKHEIEPSLLRLSLRPDTHSHILVFWEEDFAEAIAEVEGYRWIDGVRFVIKGRAGMSKPSHGTISRQDIVINRMREILAHLRPRSDGEIPPEPGYCFEGGFIASAKWGNEEAGIDIDIAGHPDAFISVWFYPLAMSKHDRPLLERMGGVLQSLGRLATSVRILRSGDRQVGPYRGQEYLATAPNSGGMRGHSFIWETEGQGTFETPAIKIELTTGHRDKNGNPQKTQLTDEQAMKLWDEVLNSFRVRPTTDPQKTSQNNPPSSPLRPLGELAGTGSICQQNGWWRCVDTGNVAGGRRRFFKAGETMPSVVLLGPPNLWQALRKKPPTYETKTVWALVDYEEGADVPSAETGTDGVNADTQSSGKS